MPNRGSLPGYHHLDGALFGDAWIPPTYVKIDVAAATTTDLIAAVAGQRIVVVSYVFELAGACVVTFRDDDVTLSGPFTFSAGDTGVAMQFNPCGHFRCGTGKKLQLVTSAAVQVSGHLVAFQFTP